MTTLTRAALVETAKRVTGTITLDDGRTVHVRSLLESDQSAIEAIAYDDKGKFVVDRMRLRRRKTLQLMLCNPDGSLMFADNELAKMNFGRAIAIELYDKCAEFAGLDRERTSIDDEKKDSGEIGDFDSFTDSVSDSESTTPRPGSTVSTPQSSIAGSPTTNSSPSVTSGVKPQP